MENNYSIVIRVNLEKVVRTAWFLLLITIPFGLRLRIYPLLGETFEFGSFFIYPIDLATLAFLIIYFLTQGGDFTQLKEESLPLKAFLVLSALAVFFSDTFYLSVYGFVRLALYATFAFVGARYIRQRSLIRPTFFVLGIAAAVQALVAIAQFIYQKSIGLSFFGEPAMNVLVPGAAKIVAHGEQFLRGSGTFAHANILAGFLVVGLIALTYLYITFDKKLYRYNPKNSMGENSRRFINHPYLWIRSAISVALFVILLGLMISFSRSGWLAALIGLFFLFGFLFREQPRAVIRALGLIALFVSILCLSFSPLLSARITQSTTDDRALVERGVYNGIGLYMAREHLFGLGLQASTPYALHNSFFHNRHMGERWMWQPAHNLYLLIAIETGVFGLLSFMVFLVMVVFGRASFYRRKRLISSERIASIAVLIALLTIGMFDHYMWTLAPGIVLLWLTITLVWASKEKK